MPENDQETVLAYLREHGRRQNLGTLRENLFAQGYSPAVVEQACVFYLNEYFAETDQPRPGCWRIFLRLSAGLVLFAMALLTLLFGLCNGGYIIENGGLTPFGFFLILSGVLFVLAVIASYYAFNVRRK